ncbi:hypothetical protein EDB92DRAFT_1501950 [Lactarius akahatsu]|uniref:Uncharacterized protein n=1 Tax=Lactarius akahatsu TaxID=416441 RepID=A0AAD4LAP0_9AGAM|nr:hypothetical protein EDB92DRAFT_1501950 [Lactarius akahatsu]
MPCHSLSHYRPRNPGEVSFSCRKKQGAAVLSLPIQARCENTVALGDFGDWAIEHIDRWFAWARELGMGINRMEDIILVTGAHLTRSWTNVAFLEGQTDARVSFRVQVVADTSINWDVSPDRVMGAVLSYGPTGENLPEDQCIFLRGYRVTRRLMILPRLKGAAGPGPDSKGSDSERDMELIPISTVPEYRDPLHILLEYVAESAPDCDMVLVHDDDLARLDGFGDDTTFSSRVQWRLTCDAPSLRFVRFHSSQVSKMQMPTQKPSGQPRSQDRTYSKGGLCRRRHPLESLLVHLLPRASPNRVNLVAL